MSPPPRTPEVNSHFYRQFLILLLTRSIEPLSLTQLFPYINPMVSHLLPLGTSPSSLGRYSGALESAFAVGSFLCMYQWGRLSDRRGWGRKRVMMMGLAGTGGCSVLFGLSRNYYMAFVARLLGGALCGNASVIRAVMGEITPPEAESWAYPLWGTIWDLSAILGPLFGAALSNPSPNSWLGQFQVFRNYPYFAPCAVVGVLAGVGVGVVGVFFEETLDMTHAHPPGETQRRLSISSNHHNIDETTRLLADDGQDLVGNAREEVEAGSGPESEAKVMSMRELLRIPLIQQILISSFLMAFLSLGFDAIFILFLYSPQNLYGLSFPPYLIATCFSTRGILSIASAILIYPYFQRRFGSLGVYRTLINCWGVCYALPWGMNWVARREGGGMGTGEGRLGGWTGVGMGVLLIFYTAGDFAFAPLSIATNRAAPNKRCLGALNGISLSVSALGRALGPGVGGLIYSISAKYQFPYIWIIFTGIVALASAQSWLLRFSAEQEAQEREVREGDGKGKRIVDAEEGAREGYGAVATGPEES